MDYFTEIKKQKIPFNNSFGLYIGNSKDNKYFIFSKNKTNDDINYGKLIPDLISDYFQGNYTKIPFKTILSMMSLLIFIVKPKKKICDKITITKSIKVFSLSLIALQSFKDDLLKYQNWKKNQMISKKIIRVN